MSTIEEALKQIESKFGKGSVFLTSSKESLPIEGVSTGSLNLDKAIGVGGFPKGRITELLGVESSGKSSMCLHAIANSQKEGKMCAFIDSEHSLSLDYAEALGVQKDKLYLCQPDCGEQALDILEELLKSNSFGVIAVDSVAALVPRSEIECDYGDAQMGSQARMMSQAMRKLTAIIERSNTVVIFTNQWRCLDENTVVFTPSGINFIKNLKKGDILLTSENKEVKVINTHNEIGEGFLIKTRYKGDIIASGTHRHFILKDSIREVLVKEIKVGDFFISPIVKFDKDILKAESSSLLPFDPDKILEDQNSNIKKISLPKLLDNDLAFFMGAYYSDGSIIEYEKNRTFRISFTENNLERFDLVVQVCKRLFGEEVTYKHPYIRIEGKHIVLFCKKLGLNRYGDKKVVPQIIIDSPMDIVISFLRGVCFDSHRFDHTGFIITNENPSQTNVISNLLLRLGIKADQRNDRSYFYNRIHITGEDAIKFSKMVGFSEKTKQDYSMFFRAEDKGARGKYDIVPYFYSNKLREKIKKLKIKGISKYPYYYSWNQCILMKLNSSRKGLISLLECIPELEEDLNFLRLNTFCEVLSISKVDSINLYDIEVEEGSFIANSFLTHNSKIGGYGNPNVSTGGNALKYYASVRIDLSPKEPIKKGEEIIGREVQAKVIKNKVACPFKIVTYTVMFGKGVVKEYDILNLAVDYGIIEKAGSWYSYGEERIGQGKENVIEFFKTNEKVIKEIEDKLKEKLFDKKADQEKVEVQLEKVRRRTKKEE